MNQTLDLAPFDTPTHKRILGLAEDQPIGNWYDMLGVPRQQADERAIERALLERICSVRRYEMGGYQDQAVALLEELAKAYLWLTDAEERAKYDSQLRTPVGDEAVSGGAARGRPAVPASPAAPPPRPRSAQPATTAEAAPPATAGICPQCGKRTSPKSPVCYHCGFRRAADGPSAPPSAGDALVAYRDAAELARQDLTPEQILERLREARFLYRAGQRGSSAWRNAFPLDRVCYACHVVLEREIDACGLEENAICDTREYLSLQGRKVQALGRRVFQWPLSDADLQFVRQTLRDRRRNRVLLLCRSCARKLLKSPRVTG